MLTLHLSMPPSLLMVQCAPLLGGRACLIMPQMPQIQAQHGSLGDTGDRLPSGHDATRYVEDTLVIGNPSQRAPSFFVQSNYFGHAVILFSLTTSASSTYGMILDVESRGRGEGLCLVAIERLMAGIHA